MDYAMGLILGGIIGLCSGYTLTIDYAQNELIDRGLAIHCPADGAFAFIGECDND